MNVIRETKNNYRLLENFWESQIESKAWLIDNIQKLCNLKEESYIYVFGGWYGILAQCIVEVFPSIHIISVDMDATCQYYGNKLMLPNDRIQFICSSMESWNNYHSNTSLVINTSTEHVSQHVYDSWYKNIPVNIPIALQGNNFFECPEHVRCTKTLEEFKTYNNLDNYLMEGSLNCKTFTRWMTIGFKQ